MILYERYTNTGATANVTWSPSRQADDYSISVILPGEMLSTFTTNSQQLMIEMEYNVNYTITITARNCAGSNRTIVLVTLGETSKFIIVINILYNFLHNVFGQ